MVSFKFTPTDPVATASIRKLQKFALQPMEFSKGYFGPRKKQLRAVCTYPPIFGPMLSDGVI